MASAAALAIAISTTGVPQANQSLGQAAQGVAGIGQAAQGVSGHLANMASTAASFAIGAGLTQLPGMLLDWAHGAADDEAATMRLKQSLKNLGGDFDANLAKVNDAIDAGQKLAFSDDDIRDSFQMLAAATGDTEEALKRQQAAMDLARGANIPLATATKMLGKMNAENVEVFKKLGITIGDNATEAEALAAVQAKFGGQADTYAKSTAGQFEQAKLALSETEEAIGNALLPILTTLGKTLADVLPQIQAFAENIGDVVGPALKTAFEALAPFIDGLGKLAGGDFAGAAATLGQAISDLAPKIGAALVAWGQQFVDWVVPAAANMVTELAKVELAAIAWIAAQVRELQTQLGVWAAAFVDWIADPTLPTLKVELPKIALAIATFLQNEALPTAQKVIAAFAGFWTWIGTDAVPAIQRELPKIGDQLALWLLNTAIPWAAENMPKLGEALITGIVSGLSGAWVSKLMPWLKGLVSGEGGGGGPDAASIVAVLNAANPFTLLSSFAGALMSGLLKGLVDHWAGSATQKGVRDFFVTLPQSIVDAIGNVDNLLVATGTSILGSLESGLKSGVESLNSTISEIVNAIPQFIRDLLDIHSPSDVMAGLGANIVEGLKVGMLSKLGGIDGVVKSLTDKFGGLGGGGDLSDPQFGGAWSGGWDPAAIAAACGAIAAEGFADYYGKASLSVGDILGLAEKAGAWTREGWKGPGRWSSFVSDVLGIPNQFTDLAGAISATSEGKPVAISSPKWFHYFLAQGWDGKNFFVGNTGANALKGGSEWMSPGQIGGGSTFIRGHKDGGWLTEPILGIGLRTGQMHSFVEDGRPEYVSPAGRAGGVTIIVNDPHQGTNIRRLVRDAVYELQREQATRSRLGI